MGKSEVYRFGKKFLSFPQQILDSKIYKKCFFLNLQEMSNTDGLNIMPC